MARNGDSGEGGKFAGKGDNLAPAKAEMMQRGETEAIEGKRRPEHGKRFGLVWFVSTYWWNGRLVATSKERREVETWETAHGSLVFRLVARVLDWTDYDRREK